MSGHQSVTPWLALRCDPPIHLSHAPHTASKTHQPKMADPRPQAAAQAPAQNAAQVPAPQGAPQALEPATEPCVAAANLWMEQTRNALRQALPNPMPEVMTNAQLHKVVMALVELVDVQIAHHGRVHVTVSMAEKVVLALGKARKEAQDMYDRYAPPAGGRPCARCHADSSAALVMASRVSREHSCALTKENKSLGEGVPWHCFTPPGRCSEERVREEAERKGKDIQAQA